jgi:hypothetical protein
VEVQKLCPYSGSKAPQAQQTQRSSNPALGENSVSLPTIEAHHAPILRQSLFDTVVTSLIPTPSFTKFLQLFSGNSVLQALYLLHILALASGFY